MGEQVFPVAGRRGEGLHLADGGVDALLFRYYGVCGFSPQLPPDLHAGLREALPYRVFRQPGELESGSDPHLVQIAGCGMADAPYLFYRKRLEVAGDGSSRNDGETVRLLMFGSRLGEHLGEAEPCRDSDAQILLDFSFYSQRNGLVRGVKRPAHARNVRKGLVNGILLHLGCEAPDDAEHPPGKEAVGFIVGGQNNEIGTENPGLVQRDAPFDTHPLCGIAGAGDDPPFSPRDQGFPPEFGVDGLFAGCEEGVSVDMQDGPGPRVQAEKNIAHGQPF